MKVGGTKEKARRKRLFFLKKSRGQWGGTKKWGGSGGALFKKVQKWGRKNVKFYKKKKNKFSTFQERFLRERFIGSQNLGSYNNFLLYDLPAHMVRAPQIRTA